MSDTERSATRIVKLLEEDSAPFFAHEGPSASFKNSVDSARRDRILRSVRELVNNDDVIRSERDLNGALSARRSSQAASFLLQLMFWLYHENILEVNAHILLRVWTTLHEKSKSRDPIESLAISDVSLRTIVFGTRYILDPVAVFTVVEKVNCPLFAIIVESETALHGGLIDIVGHALTEMSVDKIALEFVGVATQWIRTTQNATKKRVMLRSVLQDQYTTLPRFINLKQLPELCPLLAHEIIMYIMLDSVQKEANSEKNVVTRFSSASPELQDMCIEWCRRLPMLPVGLDLVCGEQVLPNSTGCGLEAVFALQAAAVEMVSSGCAATVLRAKKLNECVIEAISEVGKITNRRGHASAATEPFVLRGRAEGSVHDGGSDTVVRVAGPCTWPVRALLAADNVPRVPAAVTTVRRVLGRRSESSTASAADMVCMGIMAAVGAGCVAEQDGDWLERGSFWDAGRNAPDGIRPEGGAALVPEKHWEDTVGGAVVARLQQIAPHLCMGAAVARPSGPGTVRVAPILGSSNGGAGAPITHPASSPRAAACTHTVGETPGNRAHTTVSANVGDFNETPGSGSAPKDMKGDAKVPIKRVSTGTAGSRSGDAKSLDYNGGTASDADTAGDADSLNDSVPMSDADTTGDAESLGNSVPVSDADRAGDAESPNEPQRNEDGATLAVKASGTDAVDSTRHLPVPACETYFDRLSRNGEDLRALLEEALDNLCAHREKLDAAKVALVDLPDTHPRPESNDYKEQEKVNKATVARSQREIKSCQDRIKALNKSILINATTKDASAAVLQSPDGNAGGSARAAHGISQGDSNESKSAYRARKDQGLRSSRPPSAATRDTATHARDSDSDSDDEPIRVHKRHRKS
eukprot:m.207571 g.207571  ORF g.207571 m.207571 type:complete len:869 (-) comp18930_c0_seq6:232-2838(-)